MRIIDKFNSQEDEFIHPLWLGILLLISVILIISILCCLRIKYGTQLRYLFNRLFRRNIEINDNTSNDDKYSRISYSYNWPSIYPPTKNQSPKLYTLVNSIRRAQLQKQTAIRQQSSHEDENEVEVDHVPQISISSSPDIPRNSEIARKFYASMRNTSQYPNSASVDSYSYDASLTSNTPSSSLDAPKKPNHIKLCRASQFFQSLPNQESVVITLSQK